jgi:hypothetical protein
MFVTLPLPALDVVVTGRCHRGRMTPSTDTRDAVSLVDLWIWWETLTEDQRDLLRLTALEPSLTASVTEFLMLTGCPLVVQVDGESWAVDTGALTAFIRRT